MQEVFIKAMLYASFTFYIWPKFMLTSQKFNEFKTKE